MLETDNKIHVLSVSTSDKGGGAAHAAYRIHKGVGAYGVDSQMFVKNKRLSDSNICSLSNFVPKNLIYKAFDWCVGKIKNKIQHYRWNRYPNQDIYFKSDLRGTCIYGAFQKQKFDILHLHWINGRFLDLQELRNVDKPIVWTLHDSWPFCGVCHYFLDCDGYQHQCGNCPQLGSHDAQDLSHKVWKQKEKIYKNLDLHIVAPSRWLADCARKSCLFGDLDIRVIPNCLNTEQFHPMSSDEIESTFRYLPNTFLKDFRGKTLSMESRKPYILYGAVNAATDKIKGLEYLVAALKELDAKGFCANMIVFGADKANLQLSFSNISVTFVGFINDISVLVALYSMSDIMVVPSQSENLSYAIMESLACGTPVVAFDIGGNSDMVEHKQNGYLAQRKDSADLAYGIEWCLRSNADNHMSFNARSKVCECYSIDVVAQQYVNLYNQVKR